MNCAELGGKHMALLKVWDKVFILAKAKVS